MATKKGKYGAIYGPDLERTETFSGDDSETTFSLAGRIVTTGGLTKRPVVEVGGTTQTEGVDYTVDYENDAIVFDAAPATGVNNIEVTYYAFALKMTDEAMQNSDGGTYKEYQVTNASKRVLDIVHGFTVKVNNVAQPAGAYKVSNIFEGKILFDEALDSGDTVTITGGYIAPVEVGSLYGWSLDMTNDRADYTKFKDEAPIEVVADSRWSGSFDGYYLDDYWSYGLDTELPVYVRLYLDESGGMYYEGWMNIDLSQNATRGDIIRETHSFTGWREVNKVGF